jgi:hypothetical protein
MVTGKLGMALGGLVYPQPAAASASPGWFIPGPAGTRTAIWRHKTLLSSELIDTKLIGSYKACKKNACE